MKLRKTLDLLKELVAMDTRNPGGDEVLLARFLLGELKKYHPDHIFFSEVDRKETNRPAAYVFASWGDPAFLVNIHMDTVPINIGYTGDPFHLRIEGDRAIGLGAADTKGAIAALLAAFEASPPRNCAVLISGDEERTGLAIRRFLESDEAKAIPRVIVCEPTGLRVGTGHRGIVALDVLYKGKGGHSSLADSLPAPLAELARLATRFHDWGKDRKTIGPKDYPGMCLNIAKLDGGIAFNIVPSEATLSISARPPPGVDVAEICTELTTLAQTVNSEAKVHAKVVSPSFHTRSLEGFRALLGDRIDHPVPLPFWTEAALFSEAGIDAIVLGPGKIAQAHAPNEYVLLAELDEACTLFESILYGRGNARH